MYALSHILVLTGITLGAMQPDSPVEQDADPMEVMEEARELAAEGRHEAALAKLLWCFDVGGKENVAFSGVRVSFLPAQIAELGKKFPPALDALRERRDAAEQRTAKTKGTQRYMFDLMELAALNRSLKDDASNLELYDSLKSEAPDSAILEFLRRVVADELVKAGRADEARATAMAPDGAMSAGRMPAVVKRAWPRNGAGRPQSHSTIRATTAYSLDSAQYEHDLAVTQDEAERLHILKERWNDIVLAATYCSIVTDQSFHRSTGHWQGGHLFTGTWTVRTDGDLLTPRNSLRKATVLVTGDCQEDVTVDWGMVHIYGDLNSKLTISGQSEVVIGGDIAADGVIEGDGILRVFVGGNVDGRVSNKSSSMIWINGNVSGDIHAGSPMTRVHVIGDFYGQFLPVGRASLAVLDVRGSMPSELVEKAARYDWTEFNASIGASNVAPGIYPKGQALSSHWVVHSQVR